MSDLPTPPAAMDAASASVGRVLFEATLRPHRSLPPAAFLTVMLLVSGISFAAGVAFVLMGAWPVTGFFGLDVLLLYGALRLSYRSGRMSETFCLRGDTLTVERVGVRGEHRRWAFQAFWLRVRLITTGEDSNRLLLTSHGRSLSVAGFLSAEERRILADDLENALARYKAGSM